MNALRNLFRPSVLTVGFAVAIVVWWTWFITHLPWLGIGEQISLPTILALWLLSLLLGAIALYKGGLTAGESVIGSATAGLISSLLGLLILGSKLTTSASDSPDAEVSIRPSAALVVLGFLLTGLVLGIIAGLLGTFFARPTTHAIDADQSRRTWLGRFAIVAAIAVVPLLIIGGLVTSTNSGMAVPDWPNTYGTNMFLYPLGPRAAPSVFLEHSHRLFGALVGLTAIGLCILVMIYSEAKFLRFWAVAILILVIAQGVLGGMRVLQGSTTAAADAKWSRVFHGILAQIVFCLFVAMAVYLSPLYQRVKASVRANLLNFDGSSVKTRFFRFAATGALHATLLQLVFGAMYRHTRSPHALWTHVGFSFLVVVFVSLAAFAASGIKCSDAKAQRFINRVGIFAGFCVGIQFLLGWLTFFIGGTQLEPANILQVIVRSIHQANGALLLALVTILFLWARALAPKVKSPATATPVAA